MNIVDKIILDPLTKTVRFLSRGGAQAFPINPQAMPNDLATQLGYKIYSHGTTYFGGNAPTVTLLSGGGTLSSVSVADFIPYQAQDGSWRMRFNVTVTLSSTSRSNANISVAGVTFAAAPDQTISGQATVASAANSGYALALPNVGTLTITHNTALTATEYSYSGDVKLASKPTWAF